MAMDENFKYFLAYMIWVTIGTDPLDQPKANKTDRILNCSDSELFFNGSPKFGKNGIDPFESLDYN